MTNKYRIYHEGKVEGYLNIDSAKFLGADGILNRDGCTRNTSLFMTPKSKRFFLLNRSMWQGEGSSVEEIGKAQAVEFVRSYSNDDKVNEILTSLEAQIIKEIE